MRIGTSRGCPSFPTRRSSDLDRAPALALVCLARRLGRSLYHGMASKLHLFLLRAGAGRERVAAVPRHALDGRDRKSTRLNSSHPSISYAVFCLEKKMKLLTCTFVPFQSCNAHWNFARLSLFPYTSLFRS